MYYENTSYKVSGTEQPGCLLSLKIDVSPQEVANARKLAVKAVGKQISLPGFRKGKVPGEVIEKNYKSQIEREWQEIVSDLAFQNAITLTHRPPRSSKAVKTFKLESCSLDQGASLVIEYEHAPQIPSVALNEVEFSPVERPLITEEQIEEGLKNLRLRQATWEPVEEERPVQEGDYVVLSLEVSRNEAKQKVLDQRNVQVNETSLPAWLKAKVIGLKKGQELTGELENTPAGETPASFHLILHRIETPILPALEEEFFKRVGADSLEDLRERIRSVLQEQADVEFHERLISSFEKALVEKYLFELPESLLQDERSAFIKEAKRQGLPQEEAEKNATEYAPRNLRRLFLLRQIGSDAGIEVPEAAVREKVAAELSRSSRRPTEEELTGLQTQARTRLFFSLVREYVLSQIAR